MGKVVIRLVPDRGPELGNGLVQFPLANQGDSELVVGLAVVRLDPDHLAVFGQCRPCFPWALRAMPRQKWALAFSGSRRMAVRNSVIARRSHGLISQRELAEGDVAGGKVLGLEPDRFAILGDRFI